MSIPIAIDSIEIVGEWKYDCKNVICICGQSIYDVSIGKYSKYNMITEAKLFKRDCGHIFHYKCYSNKNGVCQICKNKSIVNEVYSTHKIYL